MYYVESVHGVSHGDGSDNVARKGLKYFNARQRV